MTAIGRLAQDAIAMRFEGEGEAWSDTTSGDRLAQIAVEELEHRHLLGERVWREGNRIRNWGGIGYNDVVSDGEIWRHVATSVTKKDVAHIEFAMAVLRYRVSES